MALLGKMMVALGLDTAEFDNGVSGVKGKMEKFGGEMTKVGGVISIGLTAPLVGIGAMALQSAGDFEQSMNIMQAISGATAEQMQRLQAEALKLGAETSFSAGEAADGMLELSKAGLGVEDTISAIPGVMDLAAASGMGLAESATVAANAINAFKLPASDTVRIANLLAAAANASSVDVTDLAQSFSAGSAVWASNGQKIEYFTTALALLGNNAIKGSDAGTSLKTMMMRLAAPTEDAAGLMKELGIKVYDAQGQMLPFPEILKSMQAALMGVTAHTTTLGGLTKEQAKEMKHYQTVIASTQQKLADYASGVAGAGMTEKARQKSIAALQAQLESAQAALKAFDGIQGKSVTTMREMTQEERNQALSTLFGSDAIRAANILLAEGTDSWNKMATAVNAEGAATEAANARMKGWNGALEYLKGSIDSLYIGQILPFLDTLSKYPRALGDMATSFGTTSVPVRLATLTFIGLVAAGGAASLALGGLVTAMAALISPVTLVILAVALLGTAWTTNFMGIQERTQAAAIAIGSYLAPLVQWFQMILPFALNYLGQQFTAVWNRLPGVLSAAGDLMQAAWSQLVATFGPSVQRLVTAFAGLGGQLMTLGPEFQKMGAAVQPLVPLLGTALNFAIKVVAIGIGVNLIFAINLLTNVFKNLVPIIRAAINETTAIITVIVAVVQNMVKMVNALIHGDWSTAWEAAKGIVSAFGAFIKTSLGNLWVVVSSVFAVIAGTIRDSIAAMGFDKGADAVQSVIDKVTSLVTWLKKLAAGDISLNFTIPAWIDNLMKWVWPALPEVAWVTALLAFAWPVLAPVAWVVTLMAWVWPTPPGQPSWIERLVKWAWPDFDMPAWLERLFAWHWPTLPTLPSWLGGGGSSGSSGNSGNSDNTATGSGYSRAMPWQTAPAAAVAPAGGPTITIGPVNIYNDMDVETLAYKVQQVLRRK